MQVKDDEVYVMSPFRDVQPLREMQEQATGFIGRRLLYGLLSLVSTLHSKNIYGVNICLDTVFFADDVEIDVDTLVVGGLTNISSDQRYAISDCYQIFLLLRTLVANKKLPSSWIGNQVLDNLLAQSIRSRDPWPYSVREVCQQLGTDLTQQNELWSYITIQRSLEFHLIPQGRNHHLRAEDVKLYLQLSAITQFPGVSNIVWCRRAYSMAIQALSHVECDGLIDIADYQVFDSHLKYRHQSNMGLKLALELPSSGISTNGPTIRLDMKLRLPYQRHYGFINLDRLYQFMPSIHIASTAKYEVRGPKGFNGIFVTSEVFRTLTQTNGLRCDTSQIYGQRDCALDSYQHPEWYLITANESAELYHGRDSLVFLHERQATIGEFLQEQADTKDYLDIATSHQLDGLDISRTALAADHQCVCSTIASTDDYLNFRFGRRVKPPLDKDIPQRQGGRTLAWLDSQSERARIIPTVFTTRLGT